MEVKITKSNDKKSKYKATFFKDGKTVVVSFGAYGYGDFIYYSKKDILQADSKKKAYIARHKVNEDFEDPLTAGALSRWILWNKSTLEASIQDYKKRFNLL